MQISERVKAGDVAIAYTTERMDYNDAFAAFSSIANCGKSADATFRWCNEQAQRLLNQAERLPLASAQRTGLYQQMQEIMINQDVSQFVIGWRRTFGLARDGGTSLHLIYGMPDLETMAGTQP
jgi:ABC-type transport system substrate-binding protein